MSNLRSAALAVLEAYDSHEPLAIEMEALRAALDGDKCAHCAKFFAAFRCSAASHGECDCPKCQGFCECNIAKDGVCEAVECCKERWPVAVTEVVRTAPTRIGLQISDDLEHKDEPFPLHGEVTWCQDSVMCVEVEYVRADLANPPRREWRGLTQDEVEAIWKTAYGWNEFIRAIESKLKEHNA